MIIDISRAQYVYLTVVNFYINVTESKGDGTAGATGAFTPTMLKP